jgi:hypothetical protein
MITARAAAAVEAVPAAGAEHADLLGCKLTSAESRVVTKTCWLVTPHEFVQASAAAAALTAVGVHMCNSCSSGSSWAHHINAAVGDKD